MVRRIIIASLSILALSVGTLIYLLYRPKTLVVFSWVETIGLSREVNELRSDYAYLTRYLPSWVIYNLPNGLWSLSYALIIYAIWNVFDRQTLLISGVIPLMGVLWEFMQQLGLISGTFDFFDIAIYLTGWIVGVLLVKYVFQLKSFKA